MSSRHRLTSLLVLLAGCAEEPSLTDAGGELPDAAPDAAPVADAMPPPDATPWRQLASGTTADILTFVRPDLASTAEGIWIAPLGDDAWAPVGGPRPPLIAFVDHEGLAFGAVEGEPTVQRSTDGGESWAPLDAGATGPVHDVLEAHGTFLTVGGRPAEIRLWGGLAGMAWTAADLPTLSMNAQLRGATPFSSPSAPFMTIAVGISSSTALVLASTNFSGGFVAQTSAGANGGAVLLRSVAWNRLIPGVLVAVGDEGRVMRSVDGHAWSRIDVDTTADLLVVRVSPRGRFVAAGRAGTVLVSPDGRSFTVHQLGDADLRAVAFDDTRILVAGAGGTLFAMEDH